MFHGAMRRQTLQAFFWYLNAWSEARNRRFLVFDERGKVWSLAFAVPGLPDTKLIIEYTDYPSTLYFASIACLYPACCLGLSAVDTILHFRPIMISSRRSLRAINQPHWSP